MWLSGASCHHRKKGPSGGQAADDPKDDFDDEETFLNLDDVLEGEPSSGYYSWATSCYDSKSPPGTLTGCVDCMCRGHWH